MGQDKVGGTEILEGQRQNLKEDEKKKRKRKRNVIDLPHKEYEFEN